MKSMFIDKEFKYDGTQLRSLYAYLDFELMGDSVVSWIGACDISNEHMVDGEDLLLNAAICGDKMLHFIIAEAVCLFSCRPISGFNARQRVGN